MEQYSQIVALILGIIGVIHTTYRLRKDLFPSRRRQEGKSLGKSSDTTPVKFRKHA